MNFKLLRPVLLPLLLFSCCVFGQDISLYQQFNGRFDFTFLGNSLNPIENSYQEIPIVNTAAAANLMLSNGDIIEKAYLYWAGSGTGDFDVKLNGIPITAQRTFAYQRTVFNEAYDYFSAFADVTSQLQSTGNGTYVLSEFDVSAFIDQHFQLRTNFAGWALIVIYKNNNLPLNQLNVYDGMQAIPDQISINLESLNVIDDNGAKIGFLAWEGDRDIANNETLRINSLPLSNPPLNPIDNAFNGTNSFTGSETLYNMDLDVYDIEGNIAVGDTSALIEMTSSQDFVMVNAVVTKLNSQVPDATITIDDVAAECLSDVIVVDYTVSNLNSTNPLPGNVPISAYANGILVGTSHTTAAIPIGGSQQGQMTLNLPANIPPTFELVLSVDDNNGNSTVIELNENNNTATFTVDLPQPPVFNTPENLVICNLGTGNNVFDFSFYPTSIAVDPNDQVQFFHSQSDASNNLNPIPNTANYLAGALPETIWVRISDADCYSVTSFDLNARNCPPIVYNFVSVNNDGHNDVFHIGNLRGIFLNYKLEVYNRWGALVWVGNNNTPEWDGTATKGFVFPDGKVPDSTYYYILYLNDPDYPEPMKGFLYLTH